MMKYHHYKMKIEGSLSMKQLIKKPWFIGVIMTAILAVIGLLNLWALSIPLLSPYETDDFFSLANRVSDGTVLVIFGFVMVILYYVSLSSIVLSTINTIRKSQWGMILVLFSLLGFSSAFIVFQTINNLLSVLALTLMIINIILIIGLVVLLVYRKRLLVGASPITNDTVEVKPIGKSILRTILVINVLSILVFMTTFIVPLYTLTDVSPQYHAIIIRALFFGDTNLEIIGYFLANFTILLGLFLYFSDIITHYFFDQERFIQKSKNLINFIFIATVIFFIAGLALNIYYTLEGNEVITFAFIPVAMMVFVIFGFAILKGKYHIDHPMSYKVLKFRYAKIEPLLYVVLLTAVTASLLFMPIIVMQITFGNFDYNVNLTGLKILLDYPSLDPGYRLVAYVLVVMLISSGLVLVITISSYLSNFKQFNAIVKLATIVNVFFVFIISIAGYYFQIAQEINQAIMLDMFDFYGISLPSGLEYEYNIGTNAIVVLFAAIAVLTWMFFRKAFDREAPLSVSLAQGAEETLPLNSNPSLDESKPSDEPIEEAYQPFDPCPAFTDLDSKKPLFDADLEKRKSLKTNYTNLNQLVNFVVDYAKNSRLHLSYTPEDIATFVAGLGASKLSILQGMSGTGKTSLPKIFSEAVFGNCEIIEVESSWKDKNELLGYYNEFSMKYTPKKFTLALYKAALNPEVFTFILLDEMNLSRIEYYFSDFLSLMENEENQREIKLINIRLTRKEAEQELEYLALSDGNTLKVPKNVWFIGTANRDESTFVISDKVYDRAHTMNFTKRAPKVRNYASPLEKQFYDYETINRWLVDAKKQGNFDAENSELIKSVESLLAPFNISFGNRILKQIEEFVNIYKACFSGEDVESEAVEKILLSKVVAKLETKTLDDKEKLEQEFTKLKLHQCAAFIRRLDND
jgi:hypothetical protein